MSVRSERVITRFECKGEVRQVLAARDGQGYGSYIPVIEIRAAHAVWCAGGARSAMSALAIVKEAHQ